MTNEYMIALPLFQWVQLSPLAKLTYSQKCSCAAMFWMRCLNGRYDICDSKSRRAQAALVRPYFDRWAQAFGADKATTGKMWDAIVSDVRNCAGIIKGRELGMINDLTYQKIGDGSIGHAEIAKMAIEVSKEQQRVEAAATDNTIVNRDAARTEEAEVEGGVGESSREVAGTVMPTARAAAISCGFYDELKRKAAEMGLSVGKMARVMLDKQRMDLLDVCAGVKYGSAKQSRRLDAAAELAKRNLHPRAQRIHGGGPSGDEESSEDDDDDEEDVSSVFAGMGSTSVIVAARVSEVFGQFSAFASTLANIGHYRQDEDCERARRMKRHRRVDRIQGGGDGGDDGENEVNHQSQDEFEPEAEGEVTFQVCCEIQSGATTQRRGAHGFEKPCTVNAGKGVYDILAFCEAVESGRRHLTKDFVRYYLYNFGRMLWDLAGVQHLYGDSGDTITHLAVQGKDQRILEHEDSADISPQLIMTIGDFDGGMLEVLVHNKWVRVDTRYRPTLVEGRCWHRVTPITRGRRIVLIVFKNTDRNRNEAYPHLSSGYLK